MNLRPLKTLSLGLVLAGCASLALGQYAWIDNNGVRQYSDMPPPASIPRSQILKEPASTVRNAPPPAESDSAAKPRSPMTTAERNADFQKRQLEQAEKNKKEAEAASQRASKAANCDKARSYARSLEDGVRIVSNDKNGERGFLSDEQRALEVRTTQRALSECK